MWLSPGTTQVTSGESSLRRRRPHHRRRTRSVQVQLVEEGCRYCSIQTGQSSPAYSSVSSTGFRKGLSVGMGKGMWMGGKQLSGAGAPERRACRSHVGDERDEHDKRQGADRAVPKAQTGDRGWLSRTMAKEAPVGVSRCRRTTNATRMRFMPKHHHPIAITMIAANACRPRRAEVERGRGQIPGGGAERDVARTAAPV